LVLALVCLLGVRSLNRLQDDRSKLLVKDVASLQAALEVEVRLRQIRQHSLLYVMDPSPLRQGLLEEDHLQFEAAMRKAHAAIDQTEEAALLASLDAGYRDYRRELYDRSRWPSPASGVARYVSWADAHPVRHLLVTCDELRSLNRRSMSLTATANEALTGETRFVMILLGVLGPLAGLIGGVGISRAWSRSFAKLQMRIHDARTELDREIGSIQVAAEGDWQDLDQQMAVVSGRVREVVAQLQEQQKDLLQAEQMAAVGHLAAGVAHEVRNPLTGIKILIEAALRPDSNSVLDSRELRMILDEIRRVERTVQTLLDFARPASSVRVPLDLAQLLAIVVESLHGRFEQKKLLVVFQRFERPLLVEGDSDQLRSLFGNILINAIEASPSTARSGSRRRPRFSGNRLVFKQNLRDALTCVDPQS
jgi:two-component system, NtrC family, sensor histidine kinase HydH